MSKVFVTNFPAAVSSGTLLDGVSYDAITYDEPDTVTEEYTYKTGGASGTTVATVTITYTDDTKETLVSIVRT